MKKLIFGLIATIMFSLNTNAQTTKSEPVYGKDVTISSSNKIKGAGVGFLLDLGRASRKCRGFGVCDVVAFWIVIYKGAPANSNQLVADIKGEKGGEYLLLELNTPLNSEIFDTNFYIDNDLTSKENQATITKGIYSLDPSIGNFGGYKIPVSVK
jgi:hypothetical protein